MKKFFAVPHVGHGWKERKRSSFFVLSVAKGYLSFRRTGFSVLRDGKPVLVFSVSLGRVWYRPKAPTALD